MKTADSDKVDDKKLVIEVMPGISLRLTIDEIQNLRDTCDNALYNEFDNRKDGDVQ